MPLPAAQMRVVVLAIAAAVLIMSPLPDDDDEVLFMPALPDEPIRHESSTEFLTSMWQYLALSAAEGLAAGRMPRRFWREDRRSGGFWEHVVQGTWATIGQQYPDVEDRHYVECFRVTKAVFWELYEMYGARLERENTRLMRAVPGPKRFAMLLEWYANSSSYQHLATRYNVSKAFVTKNLREGTLLLRRKLVPASVQFPTGQQLVKVMADFKKLAGLPHCFAAIDGTFFKIRKPQVFGADSYWCYKQYPAITILAAVDADGIFTWADVGKPGSVGDAGVWNTSKMKRNIEAGVWGNAPPLCLDGYDLMPYCVADTAFALSDRLTKCYVGDASELGAAENLFNYSVIRTRRVVEQAFGRLKNRWRILYGSNINDASFAAKVALNCLALHNVCERSHCTFDLGWLPNSRDYNEGIDWAGPRGRTRERQRQRGADGGFKLREVLTKVVNGQL
jgi:hypothetical protein